MSRTASARAQPPARPAAGKTRRPRRPSLTESQFLEQALAIFVDKGFEGTSIDAITAAVGIAKRTIYARYGDKETLFKAAIKQGIDDWIVPVERLRAAETEDLEATLLAIGTILVDNILQPAGLRLLRLTNAVSGRMPTIGEHNVRHGEDPTIAYLADLFQRKLPAIDSSVNAEEIGHAFLHLVVGGPAIAAAWGVERDRANIARQTQLSVRIFLNGMPAVVAPRGRAPALPPAPDPAKLVEALNEATRKLHFVRSHLDAQAPE